jgi:hypothetical protein
VGNARQGYPLSLADGARGEDDLQLAGDELGVLVEGLVEVAQAEEDDGLGEAALYLQVLTGAGAWSWADGSSQGSSPGCSRDIIQRRLD